ncbi:MAG: rhodanese-like domain-containing protein [Tissierellia bacterium]|nr:rhodanese-like domain-containing protein [Tissierellia bacterium]
MKQEYMLIILILLLAFYIISSKPPKGVEKIGVEKLKELKQSGGIILDVRTPEEYQSGHIPGSKNHPLGGNSFFAGLPKDKTKPLIVYCRSGKRAVTAEKQLLKRGYKNIYHFGSVGKWTEGYE